MLFLFLSLGLYASLLDSIFMRMPDKLIPTLTRQQRFELAEYFKAQRKDSTQNRFGKSSILIQYDTIQNHLLVKTSASSTTEIRQFQKPSGETYLGVICTVSMPVTNSSLSFYNSDWSLSPISVSIPQSKTFVSYVQLRFHETEHTLMATYQSILTTEDEKIIDPDEAHKKFIIPLP
ncbi:MAG: hypothetical protein AUK44_10880 [Porphyromonadaceae bacterium CG2_30_38_12]|nr:MAG: hypothetical protein AUK44_10880 [Porphyromonadaceae bacterium CG2_30_38_12]